MDSYLGGINIQDDLRELTKEEIMRAGEPVLFSKADRRTRMHLLETVALLHPLDQYRIHTAALTKQEAITQGHRSKRQRTLEAGQGVANESDRESETDFEDTEFLLAQDQSVVRACIGRFIDRTGNKALAMVVCLVCARSMSGAGTMAFSVHDIPNRHLLAPFQPHPAHKLVDGMLLQSSAIVTSPTGRAGAVCDECLSKLRENKVPRLALANDMWIGEVPFELSVLTLPEQMLIARNFPAALIIKMYPKAKGARSLNNGLQGNVSTYRLDTKEIASMIGGNLMPHPTKVLASTISVTFVGPKNLPEKSLPGFLRVRRARVRTALAWLRENNPLYADIIISEERLSQVFEDGIPLEIIDVMRYSNNMEELDRERAGYVPDDNDFKDDDGEGASAGFYGVQAAGVIGIDEDGDPDGNMTDETPAVVALQALGVIDVGATYVGENEVLAHALANSSVNDLQNGFAIKRGSTFVNEYARTNSDGKRFDGGVEDPHHLAGAFPVLWPYAKGLPETDRPVAVPYNIHIQAALQYCDRRFSLHHQFIFQAFGVLQKRQVCTAACLQVQRKTFVKNQEAFRVLTPKDLMIASGEESRKIPFSNPIVKALRSQITAMRAKVMGTDESRVQIRSQIKGMCVMKGPPSLWITINPSDTGDPIAQVIAGDSIDLDSFVRSSGPNSEERSRTIAADPYAAAKFFHFVIAALLEEVFGIKAYKGHSPVQRTDGVFGKVASYIGTVEAQGRGTLHLHLVVWLCGALTSVQMKDALRSRRFRAKVTAYIAANIRADLDGADSSKVNNMPRTTGVSYSRPCDPRKANYDRDSHAFELQLAKAVQHHKCSRESCLIVRNNRIQCKRRAPFEVSSRDYIDEDGHWAPKRTYGYINNWCPALMQCIRANHDIKLITNGSETRDISFYISLYVAKRQANTSNSSALLAKKLAFHKARERYNSDVSRLNKRLLQRCANTLTREQEFSGPEVISYLMGWGDRFISHFFVTIYWSAVTSLIKRKFPTMNLKRHNGQRSVTEQANDGTIVEHMEETVTLKAIDGVLTVKDDLKDYVDRGNAMANWNMLAFFLDTYEGTMVDPSAGGRGRPQNVRVPYLEGTGHGNRCQVIRSRDHETMPNFIGEWFPRNDVPELQDIYHVSMLALFMPWTDIGDLKLPCQTFKQAFDEFFKTAGDETKNMMANIQYQHECSDAALKKRTEECASPVVVGVVPSGDEDEMLEAIGANRRSESQTELPVLTFSQEDVERQIASEFSHDDSLYAEVALNIAIDSGIFNEEAPEGVKWNDVALPATYGQLLHFQTLEKLVQQVTKDKALDDRRTVLEPARAEHMGFATVSPSVEPLARPSTDLPHLKHLNAEQLQAHNILASHLQAHLAGHAPPQLLMIVIGQGGTGKSTMLNAITKTFEIMKASHLLKKTALSGVAASLIGGTTLHWHAGLPTQKIPQSDIWPDNPSKAMKDRRVANILNSQYLAIDECGMCTLDLVTLLSQVAGKVRADDGSADSTTPFGRMNVILIGDFHQFPPVGAADAALYCLPPNRNTAIVGKAIYLQFETVIDLRQQWRIDDPTWIAILQRLRVGECTSTDLKELKKITLTDAECEIPDFNKAPWDDAVLITPRNSVRSAWNRASLRKHCAKTCNILYIFDAEDTIGGTREPLNFEQKVLVAGMKLNDTKKMKGTKKLSHRVELAIGMKVMVTLNLATEADLANGSRGTIAGVILDPRERVSKDEANEFGELWLQYPPASILFHPFHYEFEPFPGLDPGIIPIFPSEVTFNIHYRDNPRTQIRRRQYPLCAAYAFTDHKSQGQTIEYVIVDIGPTRRFAVDPFAVYVVLSRSRGRNTIRLLRDFDNEIFTKHPSQYLRLEDERLEKLAADTKIKYAAGHYNYL